MAQDIAADPELREEIKAVQREIHAGLEALEKAHPEYLQEIQLYGLRETVARYHQSSSARHRPFFGSPWKVAAAAAVALLLVFATWQMWPDSQPTEPGLMARKGTPTPDGGWKRSPDLNTAILTAETEPLPFSPSLDAEPPLLPLAEQSYYTRNEKGYWVLADEPGLRAQPGPHSPISQLYLAYAAIRQNQLEQALLDLPALQAEAHPTYRLAHRWVSALIFLKQGNTPGAQTLLTEIMVETPESPLNTATLDLLEQLPTQNL
ncbi:MAG: hypothetical protein D6722_28135 [Bacteroidetes bacterium]|nr:MAG: hypothetical protein D6722_28135 [Bacteroidota bacterium]